MLVETSRIFEDIDFDPNRQQQLEDRLSVIYDLQKKHAVNTVDQLIQLRDELGERFSISIHSMKVWLPWRRRWK